MTRVGVGLASVAALTRLVGMTQWGLFSLFQAAVAPLALLGGLSVANVKYTAEALGRSDEREAARVVQTAVLVNAVLGMAGIAGLAALAGRLSTSVFAVPPDLVPLATTGFRAMGLVWLAGALSTTYLGVVASFQRFDLVARLSVASSLLTAALGVGAAAAGGSIVAVVLAQALGGGVLVAFAHRAARRALPAMAGWPRFHAPTLRRTLAFGSWQLVGAAGGLMAGWADRYVLGYYFAPALVGAYSTASLLQAQLTSAFVEVGEVLLPAVSRFEGRRDIESARRLSLLAGWTLASALGICAAALGAAGGDILALWISPDVAHATTETLRLLCAAAMAGIAAFAPIYYLLGIGRARWDAAAGMGVGVVVAVVTLALVPRVGLLGVGYGLLAGTLSRWVLLYFIWRRHFAPSVGLAAFAAHVWAPPVVSFGSMLLLGRMRDALGQVGSWPWLLAEVALALLLAAGIQMGASELLPGGPARRRELAAALRAALARPPQGEASGSR